jgi:alpha-beta hydrolase superfamily lysophospholipase
MTPGEILRQHPDWQAVWYDSPDGQYGRPAAFYQQLQELNLGRAWQDVTAPVLVVAGTGDTIMSQADSSAIAENVNRAHPARAQYVEIDGMGHDLTVDGKFHAELIPTVLEWMRKQVGSQQCDLHRQPSIRMHTTMRSAQIVP